MEKVKRKGNPQKANRRFALVLIGFIVFSLLIFIFPIRITIRTSPIHLPLQSYAVIPFLGILISALYQYQYRLTRWHIFLILICLLMSVLLFNSLAPCPDGTVPDFHYIDKTPISVFRGCEWYWGGF